MEALGLQQRPTDSTAGYSSNETGQSLVELAIMMPLLLILLSGVLDFGRVIYINIVLTNAAREIALTGATRSIESTLLQNLATQEIERAGVTGGTPSIAIGYVLTGSPGKNTIIVDISYQVSLTLSFLPFSQVILRSHTEMPVFWSVSE